MRGSASSDLSATPPTFALSTSDDIASIKSNALALLRSSDVASVINHLDRGRLELDQSMNDLRLLMNGDFEMLSAIAEDIDVGIDTVAVENIKTMLASFPELVNAVDYMGVMLQQNIHPAISDARQLLSKHLPQDPDRHLAGLFDPPGSNPGSSNQLNQGPAQAPSDCRADDTSSNGSYYDFLAGNIPGMKNVLPKFPDIVAGMKMPFTHHKHRSHIGQRGNTGQSARRLKNRDARRLQQQDQASDGDPSGGKCDRGCIDIFDATTRKLCNCQDLIECVNQLSYTDYAVIFSRGLVDEETGTIEVSLPDYSDLEDGQPKQRPNSVLDEIYDASSLLQKINTIRGLAMPGQEKCDDLLKEFHVPCRDWQNGCTESDGQSYFLVSSTHYLHYLS